MKKYLLLLSFSFQKSAHNSKEILFRVFLLAAIFLIFSRLWQLAALQEMGKLLWYLALTETIHLSVPLIYLDLEKDIRSGDLACHLCKPIHYLGAKIAEHSGIYLLRFTILGFCSMAGAYLFSKGSFPGILPLAESLIACCLAGLSLLLFHALIGLSSIRLQDCTPLCWIWQRAAFILGGLVIPIDYYPEGMQSVAKCLPFASLLYEPASLVYGGASFGAVLGKIVCWSLLALAAAEVLFRRARINLTINGG